mmetsp:Transcript_1513/g.3798  ORF Transcript_1513/g.3798 Transcript_1513/m.3798 type:complete len:215 (-) Transcript_1513:476-1120(-)
MSKYMEPPTSPAQVKVKYRALDEEGRMEERVVTQDLPEECSVKALIGLCYDITNASPRQPLELHYWGKVLEPSKLLRDYAIKAHSEIKVVLRPKLPKGALISCSDPLCRLRLVSSKLEAPIVIDNITGEVTGAELKGLVCAQLKRNAIWLCQQTANDPDACEKSGTMPIKLGDQLMAEGGGKGTLRMRRVSFRAQFTNLIFAAMTYLVHLIGIH